MNQRKEVSDTDRLLVQVALRWHGGLVKGDSLGDVARDLRVRGMSTSHVKRTLGSLCYSNAHKRRITITRPRAEDGQRRYVVALMTRSK